MLVIEQRALELLASLVVVLRIAQIARVHHAMRDAWRLAHQLREQVERGFWLIDPLQRVRQTWIRRVLATKYVCSPSTVKLWTFWIPLHDRVPVTDADRLSAVRNRYEGLRSISCSSAAIAPG